MMKNIDKIKQNFIGAIKDMTIEQFNELNTVLCEECYDNPKLDFIKKITFTCDNCRKLYGDCSDDDDSVDECYERFEKHMNSEKDN